MKINESLLKYYEKEFVALKKDALEFAKAHPLLASQLGLIEDELDDPHVERLIQAVAFLNARVNKNIDDHKKHLVDSLINILYPYYQRYVPSMAIVRFLVKENAKKITRFPKYKKLSMNTDKGICSFRTGYNTDVLPIEVVGSFFDSNYVGASTFAKEVGCLLQIDLKCLGNTYFKDLSLRKLRFFVNSNSKVNEQVYSLLFTKLVDIELFDVERNRSIAWLGSNNLKQVGFSEEDLILLSKDSYGYSAYCTLFEYFAFPQKFSFFDLVGLGQYLNDTSSRVRVIFYFKERLEDLDFFSVDKDLFHLNCTPVVNLFPSKAEPITLDERKMSYPVNFKDFNSFVYEIEEVSTVSSFGEKTKYLPFYGLTHACDADNYWHSYKEGSENFITLVPSESEDFDQSVLQIQAVCTNGTLPRELFFKDEKNLVDAGGNEAKWITAPTPYLTPPTASLDQVALMSHLVSNYSTLAVEDCAPLKEMLSFYSNSSEDLVMINSINKIRTRKVIRRLPNDPLNVFAHGLEIKIDIDLSNLRENQVTLFSAVLHSFFSVYCSLNNFVELVLTTDFFNKEIARWQPRFGIKDMNRDY